MHLRTLLLARLPEGPVGDAQEGLRLQNRHQRRRRSQQRSVIFVCRSPSSSSRTSPSPSPSHSPSCKSAPGCTTAPKKTCTSCSSTPSACTLTTTSSPASTPAAPSSLASPPANPLSAFSWTASRAARGCCRPGGRPRREGPVSGWARRSRRAGLRCASRRRRGTSMSGMGIR